MNECEHEPDLAAITMADDAIGIVDVPCQKCDVLGSTRIVAEDIQWGQEEPN